VRRPKLGSNVILGLASLVAVCGCVYRGSPVSDSHPVLAGEKAEGTAEVHPTENRSTVQASEDTARGVRLFEDGQFTAAQRFFAEFARRHPTDPAGAYYLGRLAFESEQYNQAATLFEQAVQLESGNSDYHRWLGRAYGEQAQHAGGVAFFLARKVKTHLEEAVDLNPDNIEARFDLMEYYLQAPAFVGGDAAKAKAQAEEITRRNPVEGRKAWQRCEQEDAQMRGEEVTPPRHGPAGTGPGSGAIEDRERERRRPIA
jgi:tetratricopeptide (TPR) repeat protein